MKKDYVLIGVAGAVIGVLSVILVRLGNPPNMGFCIACFERDIAGALGLHHPWSAAWLRPEILGILLGAFGAALITREFRPKGGSAPFARFIAGMFVMIGALVFLGCPLRMILRLGGGDLNAVVALVGFTLGILGGVYFLRTGFDFGRAVPQRAINGLLMPAAMLTLLALLIILPTFKPGGPIFVGGGGHIGTGESPTMTVGGGIVISLIAGLIVGVLAQRT
ncbi:MAG: YedE family putative selenium transporter, partial [Candidatus Alcyoniella australis]|nr:YedE family putative selenium transporter [Candidatus Alcyoniella australis]